MTIPKKIITTQVIAFLVVACISFTGVYASEVTGSLSSSGNTSPSSPPAGGSGSTGGGGGGSVTLVPASNPSPSGQVAGATTGGVSGGTSNEGNGVGVGNGGGSVLGTVTTAASPSGGSRATARSGGVTPQEAPTLITENNGTGGGLIEFTSAAATANSESNQDRGMLASVLDGLMDSWSLWWMLILIPLIAGAMYYLSRENM